MLKLFIFLLAVWTVSGLPHPEREPLEGVKSAVKGVKGTLHNVGHNITEFFHPGLPPNLRNLTGSSHTHHVKNNSKPLDLERGVCYLEVPTVTLVKDPLNVPAGNGSAPHLSKIRKCCPGYERNIHNFRLCDPVCEIECVNGRCVAPNVCACHPDHVLDLGGYCVPTCPVGCLNGNCGPDGECACKPGYVENHNMKFCVPKCGHGCGHGNCTAPDTCSCDEGYKLNHEGSCSPKCDNGCQDGDCVEPNKCLCHTGYATNSSGLCAPACSKCKQEQCIAPEVCQACPDGYKEAASPLDQHSEQTQCVASCKQHCLNGYCSSPDQCTCFQGFITDPNDSFKCIPHCPNGCQNGICSGPNLCLCMFGYRKDMSVKGSQKCVPISSPRKS